MQTTGVRVVSLLEWAVAALVLAGVAAFGSIVVRELRSLQAFAPVSARETLPDPPVPAGVPSRAVTVPVLLFSDGNTVRVGQSLESVTLRLGESTAPQLVERAPNGERLTRFFDYAGVKFVLVFEPFERRGEPRVAAIFLQ